MTEFTGPLLSSLLNRLLALLAAFVLSAGSMASTAQSSAASAVDSGEPFRTISDDHTERLMLFGHDPVAYFTENRALAGDASISTDYQGVKYRFASEQNRQLFIANPSRFVPQFGGYCANGVNYAIPGGGGGGPDTWRIYRGKLYVFGGQQARDHFEMDTEKNLELAHHYWNTELAGTNPTWSRVKRMVFRVPHYRSDASLQEEWEQRRDAGTLPVMPGQPQVVAP